MDGFVGHELAQAVRDEALGLVLRQAGVSRGAGYRRDVAERGDEIAWADAGELVAIRERFEELRIELNREGYLGLARFEVQVARYPGGGARYVRHRDAFPGGPNRRLTAILYLNEAWTAADGGELRLHLPDGPRDIEPLMDRLVLFTSERFEHEVLPTQAARLAVTAWYYGREDLPG